MHANLLNGKVYIGQSQEPQRRWGTDGNAYLRKTKEKPMHPKFAPAIKKYGWNNFDHIILAENLTLWQSNFIETFLILCYRSWWPEKGYNCNIGGEVKSVSEETRQKQKESSKGKNVGKVRTPEMKERLRELKKDVPLSEEHKAAISAGLFEYYKTHSKPPVTDEAREKIRQKAIGRKPSPESIAKNIESRKGYHHSEKTRNTIGEKRKAAHIHPIEINGVIYKNAKEAAAFYGTSNVALNNALNNGWKYQGYIPRRVTKEEYFEFIKEKKV